MIPEHSHVSAGAEAGLHFRARLALGSFLLDASWDVAQGETAVLVGPNGAGKSTCLAILAGLLRPDCGHVSVGNRVLCDTVQGIDLPPERRRVGLMFQDYALFPHLSAQENVAFGARLCHRDRSLADQAVAHWMQRLALEDLARRDVSTLSGGQRQRVALARTLAADPAVLLLDEPLAALDASTRNATRLDLARFLEGIQQPTIVVTHDPVDALTFGDRVLVLEAGRLVQTGPREQLLRQPQTAFVAELAGLNLYVVDLEPGRGLRVATIVGSGGLQFHVPSDGAAPPSDGAAPLPAGAARRAHAAFAPAEVTLSIEPPRGSAQNVFNGVVRSIVPLPDRLRVLMDVGAPMMADVTREAAARLQLAAGGRVWASIKALGIHVYPVGGDRGGSAPLS